MHVLQPEDWNKATALFLFKPLHTLECVAVVCVNMCVCVKKPLAVIMEVNTACVLEPRGSFCLWLKCRENGWLHRNLNCLPESPHCDFWQFSWHDRLTPLSGVQTACSQLWSALWKWRFYTLFWLLFLAFTVCSTGKFLEKGNLVGISWPWIDLQSLWEVVSSGTFSTEFHSSVAND